MALFIAVAPAAPFEAFTCRVCPSIQPGAMNRYCKLFTARFEHERCTMGP